MGLSLAEAHTSDEEKQETTEVKVVLLTKKGVSNKATVEAAMWVHGP